MAGGESHNPVQRWWYRLQLRVQHQQQQQQRGCSPTLQDSQHNLMQRTHGALWATKREIFLSWRPPPRTEFGYWKLSNSSLPRSLFREGEEGGGPHSHFWWWWWVGKNPPPSLPLALKHPHAVWRAGRWEEQYPKSPEQGKTLRGVKRGWDFLVLVHALLAAAAAAEVAGEPHIPLHCFLQLPPGCSPRPLRGKSIPPQG